MVDTGTHTPHRDQILRTERHRDRERESRTKTERIKDEEKGTKIK